eukprot:m.276942 g.276942  ORF g.276942 m.276942 type:complete len:507 (-) comp15717_c1_seq1:1740-3260(-)
MGKKKGSSAKTPPPVETTSWVSLFEPPLRTSRGVCALPSSFFVLLRALMGRKPFSIDGIIKLVKEWEESPRSFRCGFRLQQQSWSRLVRPAMLYLCATSHFPARTATYSTCFEQLKPGTFRWRANVARLPDMQLDLMSSDFLQGVLSAKLPQPSEEVLLPAIDFAARFRHDRFDVLCSKIMALLAANRTYTLTRNDLEEMNSEERARCASKSSTYAFTLPGNVKDEDGNPRKVVVQSHFPRTLSDQPDKMCKFRFRTMTPTSLVSDALARLPRGFGTLEEICDLVGNSLYLNRQISNDDLEQTVAQELIRLRDLGQPGHPIAWFSYPLNAWFYLPHIGGRKYLTKPTTTQLSEQSREELGDEFDLEPSCHLLPEDHVPRAVSPSASVFSATTDLSADPAKSEAAKALDTKFTTLWRKVGLPTEFRMLSGEDYSHLLDKEASEALAAVEQVVTQQAEQKKMLNDAPLTMTEHLKDNQPILKLKKKRKKTKAASSTPASEPAAKKEKA